MVVARAAVVVEDSRDSLQEATDIPTGTSSAWVCGPQSFQRPAVLRSLLGSLPRMSRIGVWLRSFWPRVSLQKGTTGSFPLTFCGPFRSQRRVPCPAGPALRSVLRSNCRGPQACKKVGLDGLCGFLVYESIPCFRAGSAANRRNVGSG